MGTAKLNKLLARVSLVSLVILLIGAVWFVSGHYVLVPTTAEASPLSSVKLFVNPASSAARAAAGAEAGSQERASLTRLASVPTGIWITPEKYPASTVGSSVYGMSQAAGILGQTPIFVIYGIPNRDCGNQSAGGLPATEYPAWIAKIADSLKAQKSIVILEPDSLALTDKCHNASERIAEIRSDVDALASTKALIYLDAGHSAWMTPQRIAVLLNSVGLSSVQGFALNVANYNQTDLEIAYGEKVSALTAQAHFVVDTSRNGNGSTGNWCNPSGRKLGLEPSIITGDGHHDANLWIKPPGESDGFCNGGPTAGNWWPERAQQLLELSHW